MLSSVKELFVQLVEFEKEMGSNLAFDTLKAQINDSSADVNWQEGLLTFTLPGLYDYFFSDHEGAVTYLEFRSEVYAGTLNAELAELGYVVDVYDLTLKVDTSTYCLKAL